MLETRTYLIVIFIVAGLYFFMRLQTLQTDNAGLNRRNETLELLVKYQQGAPKAQAHPSPQPPSGPLEPIGPPSQRIANENFTPQEEEQTLFLQPTGGNSKAAPLPFSNTSGAQDSLFSDTPETPEPYAAYQPSGFQPRPQEKVVDITAPLHTGGQNPRAPLPGYDLSGGDRGYA